MSDFMGTAAGFTVSALLGLAAGWLVTRRIRQNAMRSWRAASSGAQMRGVPLPPAEHVPARTLAAFREQLADKTAQCQALEAQVASISERAGRRATEIRNLESQVAVLATMDGEVQRRDERLAQLRTDIQVVAGERDAAVIEKLRAVDEVAKLREEIEWRDFVLSDMEPIGEKRLAEVKSLRARETELTTEIARLRGELEQARRPLAA